MAEDKLYRITEVVGTSNESVQQAIRNAVRRAKETLRNVDWFEVGEIRGTAAGGDGDVEEFQVTVRIGFRLEG